MALGDARGNVGAMAAGFWPVAVVPVGRVACASTLWRAKGRLHVTCVVKARFEMVHNGYMRPILPEPVRPQLGEVAPYLTQADVVITGGRAHCVPPRPAAALAVRLALFREWPVIDKSLLVYPRDGGGARTVAMVPSLTLGDARPDTPAGRLVNPADPTQEARLGPVPPDAPERLALLGGGSMPVTRDGVVEIPAMFPWGYYQVAPPDQRASFLRGDEWLVLDGMHPQHARMQSRLPCAVAEVRVYPPGLVQGPCYPVEMQADQLNIDAERGHCSILWRGSFPVQHEVAARSLTLVAGVGVLGQPIVWPDVHQLMRNPVLRAHGLVDLPHPEAQEDEASMAPTRQVAQQDLLAAAGLVAQSGTHAAEPGDGEPISLRAAELQLTDDGVLWLEPRDDAILLELTPDPSVEEERVGGTVKMSGEELLEKVGAVVRRTALGLPVPDGKRLLRPSAHVVSAPAPAAEAGPSSSAPPRLEDVSVDRLELTLSEALAGHGLSGLDELWRFTKKPG